MHPIIETPTFIKECAEAGMPEEERVAIVDAIATAPLIGDLMPGTGGARKVRFQGRGRASRAAIGW